jgi:hypothetical protein
MGHLQTPQQFRRRFAIDSKLLFARATCPRKGVRPGITKHALPSNNLSSTLEGNLDTAGRSANATHRKSPCLMLGDGHKAVLVCSSSPNGDCRLLGCKETQAKTGLRGCPREAGDFKGVDIDSHSSKTQKAKFNSIAI